MSAAPAIALAANVLLLVSAVPARAELTPEQRAGKQIFVEGTSASGAPIQARIGRGAGTVLPGSAVTCGSCHGADGRGRPEGGATPSDITWSHLTKPYGHVHEQGRRHRSFDAESLARAILTGRDPDGGPLDATMPRYELSRQDLANLLAYLQVLEHDGDPGVSPAQVRLGTVLPLRGSLAEHGTAMRAILQGAIAAVNEQGGIHGRRLALEVSGYDSDREDGVEAGRQLAQRGDVLALVAGFAPAGEDEIAGLVEADRVPWIGPFTLYARQPESANPYVFHLLSGVREQARALVEFAARSPAPERPGPGGGSSRLAILQPDDPRRADAARAAAAHAQRRGLRPEIVEYPRAGFDAATVVEDLALRADTILFLGDDDDLRSLATAASARRWFPRLLVPGTLAARAAAEAPAGFRDRVFVSYPSLRSDEGTAAKDELRRLADREGLSERSRPVQVAAATALAVTTEALRRTGRALTRARLVAHLEGLFQFEAGLAPPLTYGPARRVGALGAHVVALDVEKRSFRPIGGWVGVE